jgi:hypothetical protein
MKNPPVWHIKDPEIDNVTTYLSSNSIATHTVDLSSEGVEKEATFTILIATRKSFGQMPIPSRQRQTTSRPSLAMEKTDLFLPTTASQSDSLRTNTSNRDAI